MLIKIDLQLIFIIDQQNQEVGMDEYKFLRNNDLSRAEDRRKSIMSMASSIVESRKGEKKVKSKTKPNKMYLFDIESTDKVINLALNVENPKIESTQMSSQKGMISIKF